MLEILANIDPKTRELLTSSIPDLDYLTRRKSSKVASEALLKVIPQVCTFIQEKGAPPWERLHMGSRAFLKVSPEQPNADSQVIHFKEFDDGILVTKGVSSEIPFEQTMGELEQWVQASPFRKVDFPVGERIISMMLTHPRVEELVQLKADYLFLKQANELSLPELAVTDCWLLFRTDVWKNKQNGEPGWLAVVGTVEGHEVGGANRRIVRCVEAMLALGQEHFKKPQ